MRPYVLQPDSVAFTLDRRVPPPARVSGGENLTVPENEQLTEPFAHSSLGVPADPGEVVRVRRAKPNARATAER